MWTVSVNHTTGNFPAFTDRREAVALLRKLQTRVGRRYRYAVVRERGE